MENRFRLNKLLQTASLALLTGSLLAGCASSNGDISKDSLLPKEQPRQEVQDVLDHYPPGWVNSTARADMALESIDIEKRNATARLYNEKLECNEKFFVYWCYEEAQARYNTDTNALHLLEVEMKRFKRSEEIRQADLQNDRDAIEKTSVLSEADRRANVEAYEARLSRVQSKMAERSQAAQGITKTPNKKHAGSLMTPAEKAANEKKYQEKQAEVLKRQERVARKRAQTAEKRAKKAAEEAAKAEANK